MTNKQTVACLKKVQYSPSDSSKNSTAFPLSQSRTGRISKTWEAEESNWKWARENKASLARTQNDTYLPTMS